MEDMMNNIADEQSARTRDILDRFNDVFQTHDPAPLADLVAAGCVVENSVPAPEGARYEIGRAHV